MSFGFGSGAFVSQLLRFIPFFSTGRVERCIGVDWCTRWISSDTFINLQVVLEGQQALLVPQVSRPWGSLLVVLEHPRLLLEGDRAACLARYEFTLFISRRKVMNEIGART